MRGTGFRSTFIVALMLLAPTLAVAQTPSELAEARRTFTSALADEEHASFEAALEKYRRVQAVRETVAVRYRIGACLEALGRLKEAMAAYEGAIALGSGGDPNNAEAIKAARAKVADLAKRLPQLTISLSEPAPPGAEVALDREGVPAAMLRTPISVDPGTHAVSATAPGAAPFHTELTLAEGAHLALTIPLGASAPPEQSSTHAIPSEKPAESPRASRTAGWITLGAGAALLLGAGAVMLVRHGEISDLTQACPNGVCPSAREAELSATRTRAVTNGTIAAVLAGAGVVAGGVGAYFVFFKDAPSSPAVSAAVSGTDARVMLKGSF
jgi:hypothetical protein